MGDYGCYYCLCWLLTNLWPWGGTPPLGFSIMKIKRLSTKQRKNYFRHNHQAAWLYLFDQFEAALFNNNAAKWRLEELWQIGLMFMSNYIQLKALPNYEDKKAEFYSKYFHLDVDTK